MSDLSPGARRDLERARRRNRSEAWDGTILTLQALSATSLLYKAYSQIKGDLGSEDPLSGALDAARQAKKAGSDPGEFFVELQSGNMQTILITGAFDILSQRRWNLIAFAPPLLDRGTSESRSIGGLYLQRIILSGLVEPTRARRKLIALTGEYNLLHTINPLDPDRLEKIEEVISRYSAGPDVIKARRRIMES